MKYHIKLNCHDWPHRGDKSVMKLTVDADSDQVAMQLGLMQAEQDRPGAKLKVFDCERDRIEKWEMEQKKEWLDGPTCKSDNANAQCVGCNCWKRDPAERERRTALIHVPRETLPDVPNISAAMKRGAYARKLG